jgi:hypothetical protein
VRTDRKRKIRRSALATCLVALLALPAAAGAMPQPDPRIALRQENGFPLASIDARTPAASQVHVVRTVRVDGSSNTLPTVLAAVALAVAFTGAAYIIFRVRPLPRSS